MRKCPNCSKRLFEKGRCYACNYEGLLPPRPHPYRLSDIYLEPIPDFEKLFQEADKRQEEALKTFRREVRRYNKIWRACGGDVKTYLEVVNSGG